jgi:NAD(P)-dependent dehydrogenase (short-subunit alcohol dehydrogenase family)
MYLSQARVLLTGADRGVGAAVTALLLERGSTVFAGTFLEAERELESLGARFTDRLTLVPLDVSRDDSVIQAVSRVSARTPGLDIIFNVAGIRGDIETVIPARIDFDEALRVYNTNALGALRVVNAFFPLLEAGTARLVVNVSSEAGSIGDCRREGWYGYCMSKAAQNMASALLHNRLKTLGGCVIAMHPGNVRTKMRDPKDPGVILPTESAAGMITVVEQALAGAPRFRGEHPAFVDYLGIPLPW